MTHPITTYLNNLSDKLATGAATEHTHRPALAALFESLGEDIRAVNEPSHAACGAPDLAILRGDFKVGHVEAKDVGVSLDAAEASEQLKRYRLALDNLILTDYLEFRWYVDSDLRRTVRLARQDARGQLQLETNGRTNLEELLGDFLAHEPQPISAPRELAERMARLTHLIRDMIVNAFENNLASEMLTGWRRAFAEVLIPDLDQPENLGQFADMFAQTLSYGLFSARIMHQTGPFNRHTAQDYIPKTNPFLRDFFTYITGPQLSTEPYAGIVDDLIQVLALADMHAILVDFGRDARQDDPMMHFYETFLAAYDPKLKEQRGVYYTPMPVVSFIVRSVDALLKSRFGLPRGLADTTRLPDGTHKVLVLDPAVGTATFLYAVIDLIRDEFMARNDAGMWSGYVRDHLLERIFGFEIMMAPYAVAHFKLALQLAGHDLDLPEEQRKRWAYDFQADDRIRVYLTNTLEVLPEEMEGLYGPMQFVAREAKAADAVKQEKPIMVVLGNPPYSVSSTNKGEFIENLMDRYKEAVRSERNIQPLSDDYIKFIRFAHDRIERTGSGIIAMITNNSYLSGLIHRGMRAELMKSFNEIFILNLHGDSMINEKPPNNGEDKNVFDIRQGVSIVFLIKLNFSNNLANIYYKDLWGLRETKYKALLKDSIPTANWSKLEVQPDYFFFVPKNFTKLDEYNNGIRCNKLLRLKSTGIKTHRDHFVIDFEKEDLRKRIELIRDQKISNKVLRENYGLNDTRDWKLEEARESIVTKSNIEHEIHKYLYRPFDSRWIFYSSTLVELTRSEVMDHVASKENLGLDVCRQVISTSWQHAMISNQLADTCYLSSKTRENGYFFPIYLYPEVDSNMLFDTTATSPWPPDQAHGNRVPNLDPDFVAEMEGKLGMVFDPHLAGREHKIKAAFGPEDILAYIYAIFHSPTYRERYAEFLKIDFPRVPLTSDAALFRQLVGLGRGLLALHLLESPKLDERMTHYPVTGDNTVAPRGGYPKYTPPEGDSGGRVFINRMQYFEGVPPEVWAFEIGGYQVLHKWLKDRRGRALDYDDQRHYQQVVVALAETIRLMDEIDAAIPAWPVE